MSLKTPISYYGGKQMLLKYILPLIPTHRIYCEPFFGGGAVFFAKPTSEVEVINDRNSEVINFFKVMKTDFDALQAQIQTSLHSRDLYKEAMIVYSNPHLFDPVKRAWAFWVGTNQGFASQIGSWGFGKFNSKEKAVANKREDFTEKYEQRLRMVQIENNDALKVIARCDAKDAFFYVDPPYFNSNMAHYKGYTESDFEQLLKALSSIKGKFILSSYPSTILSQYIKKNKWQVRKVEKSIAVTKHTNKKKTEMIVMNYDPHKHKTHTHSLNGTSKPTPKMKQNYNPNYEIGMIERFLGFNGKRIYKNTIWLFLEELQEAILEQRIRKFSPYAKEVILLQRLALEFYEKAANVNKLVLSKKVADTFEDAILDFENSISSPVKVEPKSEVVLEGISESGKIMGSTDFASMQFDSLGFTGKWLDLMGGPAPGFTVMVFGKPKMGKSYLSIDFAGYLAKNFGKVLYIAKEEKFGKTLLMKIKEKNAIHPNLLVADSVPEDLSAYDFIFFDSINSLGLSPSDLRKLKSAYPSKSFVYIFQTTKSGNFRGENTFQHDVDVVIEVPVRGKAIQFGRYNQGGEMSIF